MSCKATLRRTILFCIALLLVDSLAIAQTTVEVTPATSNVIAGETVTLSIMVNNITDLRAVHTVLTFNNLFTQAIGVSQGPFLASGGDPVFFAHSPSPGPLVNSMTFDQAILGPTGVSGSGVLFSITFHAVVGGTSGIVLSTVDLRDPFSNVIPATLQSGTITVEDSSINVHVSQGWNIVSLPVVRVDARKTTVFPTAVSQAFGYGVAYYNSDTLFNGPGYWLKFAATHDVSIQGASITRDTVVVHGGWNIVGSISKAVLTSTVVTSPASLIASPFYGYNNGYSVADSISPGKGYWMKATSAGSLMLISQGGLAQPGVGLAEELSHVQRLEVGDSVMGIQSLYFVDDVRSDMDLEKYELPPPPPSGVLDARYGSNRILEQTRKGETTDCPIVISSPEYPVNISWKNIVSRNVSLVVGKREIKLNGSGSLRVEDQYTQVLLRFSDQQDIPRKFSLDQNYPNPFNPGTTIRYHLPVDSYVRVRIFNLLGEEIRTLVNGVEHAGSKSVEWNSRNSSGGSVASGLYFCRFEASGLTGESRSSESRKMLLVK